MPRYLIPALVCVNAAGPEEADTLVSDDALARRLPGTDLSPDRPRWYLDEAMPTVEIREGADVTEDPHTLLEAYVLDPGMSGTYRAALRADEADASNPENSATFAMLLEGVTIAMQEAEELGGSMTGGAYRHLMRTIAAECQKRVDAHQAAEDADREHAARMSQFTPPRTRSVYEDFIIGPTATPESRL